MGLNDDAFKLALTIVADNRPKTQSPIETPKAPR